MKRSNLYLILLLWLALPGCSDKVMDEIDKNPNQLTEAPLSTLLPSALMTSVYQTAGGTAAIGSSTMAELTTLTGVSPRIQGEIQLYNTTAWEGAYIALATLKDIRQKAEQEQKWGYAAIADIMTAYTLSILVDLFGDVPYTQALAGSGNRQPAFDKAQELYTEIQKLLDSGIQNTDKATQATMRPGRDDMIFGGNMGLWKKTAYGLKARLYNRLSNVNPQQSAQQALAALANSFSANESFTVSVYANSPNNGNPMANAQLSQPISAVGNGIISAMQFFLEPAEDITSDPRANLWFTRIGGKVVPAPNGTARTDITPAGTLYSKPQHLRERAAPQPLLTYTELKFIEAEAHHRLGDPEKANAAYEAAVRSAMNQAALFNSSLSLTAVDIANYVGRKSVLPGASALTLKHIIFQKYIYFFVFQGIEAYNDVRRTALLPMSDPNGTPKRLPYPELERSRNAQTPAAINERTMFDEAVRLFWAKL